MRSSRFSPQWLLLVLLFPWTGAMAQPQLAPFSRPGWEQWTLSAPGRSEPYRIFVSIPTDPAPEAGFPVIYVLDGNDSFTTTADAVRRLAGSPAQTGIQPAVVVGIGYPIEDTHEDVRRTLDLTPPAEGRRQHPFGEGQPWPPTGGAAWFRAFILDHVRPAVAARVPVDAGRETLMGHSFGGQFTLHTLFAMPDAFDNYVAISPSIWYGDRLLLEIARDFTARMAGAKIDARLLMIVGSCEQTPGECLVDVPRSAERTDFITRANQVENLALLKRVLQQGAVRGLRFDVTVIEGEQHLTVVPAAIGRGVQFALRPER